MVEFPEVDPDEQPDERKASPIVISPYRRTQAKALAPTSTSLWLGVSLVVVMAFPCFAQSKSPSSFTYEGQMAYEGKPLDTGGEAGRYDFEFRLFDQPEANSGNQIGPTLLRPGLPLEQGKFRTELDFGPEWLQRSQSWLEIRVVEAVDGQPKLLAARRQAIGRRSQQPSLPPATSDAQVLARLPAAKILISDRATPGEAHFVVDEESFKRAFGLGGRLTAVDVASVGIVAASELHRESQRSQQAIQELQAEVSALRFRSNLAFLVLAAVVITVLLRRRSQTFPEAEPDTLKSSEGADPQ
ncbi:MAG: hypothetical protein K0U98_12425 [Deltaproteobacteria bacterium]|nr:hypothetical protein [Deltaproteobacteria bacterium]